VTANYGGPLQHISDLLTRATRDSCGGGHVEQGWGSEEFWMRILRLYSKAFPTRAGFFEQVSKNVVSIKKDAEHLDAEPDEKAIVAEYASVVHSLEPLSLLEVGELYEAQGQMTDDALLHYVRRIACTARTVTNTRVTLFGCQMHYLSTLFAEC
jgi:hypothetical protein